MILFDSNILVYSQNRKDPRCQICLEWLTKTELKQIRGVISLQNINEFTSATLSTQEINKKRIDYAEIAQTNKNFASVFEIIYPSEITFKIFNELLTKYSTNKRKAYDMFLVATMLSNGVRQILTYNTKDFAEFKEIKVISPEA